LTNNGDSRIHTKGKKGERQSQGMMRNRCLDGEITLRSVV
jgi:hypothetical protein